MNKYGVLVAFLLILLSYSACSGLGQPALNPPKGSSGDKVPLYSNAQKLTVKETDQIAFISDVLGPESLLYSSSTDLSWTEDIGSKVQEQLDESLPDANWRIESDWSGAGQFQSSTWRNGDLHLVIFCVDNLDSDQINDLNKQFGISGLQPGSTLVVTHLWDTTQPLPTATSTETPTPLPTPTPTSTSTPAPTPTSTSTPLPTPTTMYGDIPFADPSNPNKLAPWWSWHPGGSEASTYDLTMEPETLTLIVGPRTDQWGNNDSAPFVAYEVPGDFEAQVKLTVVGSSKWVVAGLGIMSSEDSKTWVRTVYALDNKVYFNQNGTHIAQEAYPSNVIYLKIRRQGSLVHVYYSDSGDNWQPIKENHVYDLPERVRIYLLGFTQQNQGDVVKFHNFKITSP